MPNTSRFTGFPLSSPLWSAVGLLVLLGACGDGDRNKPPLVLPDSGSDEDAGGDAGADAGVDAQVTDWVLSGPCLADEAAVIPFSPRELDAQPAPSLVSNSLRFGMIYAEQGECVDTIVLQDMASNSASPTRRVLMDECSAARNAVGVPVDDDWLVAWFDDRNNGFQLMAARFDPTAALPTTPPNRPALSGSSDTKGSLALALSFDETTALAVWTEINGAGGAIKARPIDVVTGAADGDEITLHNEAGQVYSAVTLTAIPAGGFVLGYVAGAPQTQSRALFVQALDADGTALAEADMLDGEGDPSATLSIVMKDELTDRGAVVYSVNPAGMRPGVRFMPLDATGHTTGQFRQVAGNLEHAAGAGIVNTVSGYLVSYRAVSDFNWDFARIRTSYLSDVGNRVGDGAVDIIEASDFGGSPTAAVAIDGRVALSWFDNDASGDNRTAKLLSYPCNR